MVVQVQKSGNTFSFTLPQQAVEELALVDGGSIDVHPVTEPQAPTIRYASMEEALNAYERTKAENDYAYRELAK
jgi:antitoxin component of MazEF toxin-antitoxin module